MKHSKIKKYKGDLSRHSFRENILDFFEFMYERQAIWNRRFVLNQEFPWTKDEVLQKYKFCNVYRELDRNTIYLIKTIHENENLSIYEKFVNILAFRFFNRDQFFEEIMEGNFFSADSKEWEEGLFDKYEEILDRKKDQQSIFSDAYLVSQATFDSDDPYRKGVKHVQILLTLQDLVGKIPEYVERVFGSVENPKDSWDKLTNIHLVGPFIAYEVWCDLTYLPEFFWSDDDFAIAGPGAEWGIRLMFEDEDINRKGSNELMEYVYSIQDSAWSELKKSRRKDWEKVRLLNAQTRGPNLSRRNIEHSLCEWRKFQRLQNGQGKKRLYHR